MATFYPNSSNPRDAMANLYLRDPAGHLLYPESAVSGNTVYLNYPSSSPYSETLVGSVQPQSSCIGDLAASHLGANSYSSWKDGGNEMLFMQAHSESMGGVDELFQHSVSDESQIGFETQLGILSGHDSSLHQSNMSSGRGQGLSLSLGMQVPVPSFKYQHISSDVSALSSHQSNPGNSENYRDVNPKCRILNSSASTCELKNIMSTIPNSKYLKAAQQLLDEIVNVQNALKQKTDNNGASKSDGNHSNHQESSANSPIELSPAEKQELQNKMIKLFSMLDELDRRYKQYYNEMQIIVSSLDAIAGSNAARPYTALALQTISRHFRCLRDAIGSQIRSAQKILREQDVSIGKGCGIFRLRYIDQHIRKQKAIQQLSLISQQAWRPQRGLPENSVSILRAWLFEHFLNPYPNDSEKLMLARQTGLNRSQISNWFINARVRLWKPMVEDIYKEEFGENGMDSNSSSENATKDEEGQQSPSIERYQTNQSSQPNITARELTNLRSNQSSNINILHNPINTTEGSSKLVAYPMAELGRHNNGEVSLTLGLQHCDNIFPASEEQKNFIEVRGEDMYSSSPSPGFSPSHSQPLHDLMA